MSLLKRIKHICTYVEKLVLLSNKSVFSGALKIVEHTEENIIYFRA